MQELYGNITVQLGSVFPNTPAVCFHGWCAIVDHDGSDSMFCQAFWCVFGFGWACYIPIAVLHFMRFYCKHRFLFGKLHTFYGNIVVELGSFFANTRAVYFHGWCAIVEHDGSDSMFC